MNTRLTVALAAAALFLTADPGSAADEPWESLFDGKTLGGWKAADPRYWSVQDGAITATSSEKVPCTKNQFLIWQGGELADFELELMFRLEGTDRANSGVQIRSAAAEDGHLIGYQVDISKAAAQWLGALYDEHTGRKILALRGERVTIAKDGTRKIEKVESREAAMEGYKEGDWNRYRISAIGEKITVEINGKVTVVVTDAEEEHRDASGILALQLHSGPPMRVQFKDIRIRRR